MMGGWCVWQKRQTVYFKPCFPGFLMGILLIVILAFAFLLVEKQTSKLIKPINQLDLEEPLSSVAYEELRPLLVRIDDQNHQLKQQLEELKKQKKFAKNFLQMFLMN